MTATALVELRRYRLHPGRREELLELFHRELVDPQEAVGLQVLATFRDDDAPDDFVWLRGFATDDPDVRARALAAFYGGPVWAQHADAANATMIDSDDVLLLRPVWPAPDAVRGALDGWEDPVGLTTCSLERAPTAGELEALLAELRAGEPGGPALVLAGADVPNRFPRLPVREGEHTVAWLSRPGTGAPATADLPLIAPATTATLRAVGAPRRSGPPTGGA